MRVITGSLKGRNLKTLAGDKVRPTLDKVKEAVFSAIQFDIENCRFLDLFAGSGQMGIEALSRGAKSVVFVDKNRKCIEIIKENLKNISDKNRPALEPLSEQVFGRNFSQNKDDDCGNALRIKNHPTKQVLWGPRKKDDKVMRKIAKKVPRTGFQGRSNIGIFNLDALSFLEVYKHNIDIAFLDPPYKINILTDCLFKLSDIISKNGTIICESSSNEVLPDEISDFIILKQHKYGNTIITIYKHRR